MAMPNGKFQTDRRTTSRTLMTPSSAAAISMPPIAIYYACRLRLAAVFTAAAHFDHRPHFGKAGMLRGGSDAFGQLVVVDVRRLPAGVADQEDAVVEAARMLVGDIGVGTFHAASKIGAHEQ